jgi:hypothetical protein
MNKTARKPALKHERAHMGRVAALGCMLCIHLGFGASPAEVHHPRAGMGMGMRASHLDGIPLCPAHHRGPEGLHGLGTRAFERQYELTEADLLRLTTEALEIS